MFLYSNTCQLDTALKLAVASIRSILQTWRDLDFNFNFSLTDASRSGLFQDCLGSAGTNSCYSKRHDID